MPKDEGKGKRIDNLGELADWDPKTRQTFRRLLLKLEYVPVSKSFLNSLIKFSDMYQDIKPGPFSVNLFRDIEGINEERHARRARLYLAKKDLVKVSDKGRNKKLILTSKAHKIFYQEYPLSQLRKEKWNGGWTIITYDLPNTRKVDRDHLRNRLKELGFGSPQESLYVSPLALSGALSQFIKGENLDDFVWVAKAEGILGLSNKEVAQKSWNLSEMADLYDKLLTVLPKVKNLNSDKINSEWQKHFLAVDNVDPYLPQELTPDDWPGERCKMEFESFGLQNFLRLLFGY